MGPGLNTEGAPRKGAKGTAVSMHCRVRYRLGFGMLTGMMETAPERGTDGRERLKRMERGDSRSRWIRGLV